MKVNIISFERALLRSRCFYETDYALLKRCEGVHVYFHSYALESPPFLYQGAAETLQRGHPFTLEEELPTVSSLDLI